MQSTTLSSREFDQDTNRAKQAARQGPVFITDHDVPVNVLLSIVEYRRLTSSEPSIVELLALPPSTENADLDIAKSRELPREIDFV